MRKAKLLRTVSGGVLGPGTWEEEAEITFWGLRGWLFCRSRARSSHECALGPEAPLPGASWPRL